mmetsp:Transcript_30608/g.55823  ORF Transcript_30608/g.55823 Transcript_30608/m.55823 type:complete len:260 (-) Transcript_30608:107-886(-)
MSMTMQKLTFVLACLACAGDARRVQSSADQPNEQGSALASLLLALNAEAAFSPSMGAAARFATPAYSNLGTPQMLASERSIFEQGISRRAMLAGAAGLSLAALTKPQAASAGYAGTDNSLGLTMLDPKDIEKDDDTYSTPKVQKGIKDLKAFQVKAKELLAAVEKDSATIDVSDAVTGEFSPVKLREALNQAANGYNDDAQDTLNQLSRQILNTVFRLNASNNLKVKKDKTARTKKQASDLKSGIQKLDEDFTNLMKYY